MVTINSFMLKNIYIKIVQENVDNENGALRRSHFPRIPEICWLVMLQNVWFLVHLSRRLKCTFIVITRCPSFTLHIFDFFSETA